MKTWKVSVVSIIILSICCGQISAGEKELTIESIFGSTQFSAKSLRGVHWLSNGSSFTYVETDTATKSASIVRMNAKNGMKQKVIDGASLRLESGDPEFRFSSYQWSPDESMILFVSAPPEKQYLSRLTPAGNLFLYHVKTKTFDRLTNVTVPQYNQKFSPDNKNIGYVRNNNIFVFNIASGTEKQLTFDGSDHIINGKFDWVYEEEFGISDAWNWSPDGSMIAFWQLDEHRVPEYTMTEWDPVHLNLVKMRYPKPGDPNSNVKIGILEVTTAGITWIDIGADSDIYIPRMNWSMEKNILTYQRLNRKQNTLELFAYDCKQKSSRMLLVENSDTWVEVHDDLRFLKSGAFLWSSERDGFNQLYHYKSDGTLVQQVTKGQWDIESFYGIDEKNGMVYYTSSERSPVERHLYSIRLDGKNKKQISTLPGTHSANMSPTFDYYIGSYSSVTSPVRYTLCKNNGTEVTILEKNDLPSLKEYALSTVTFSSFTTTDGVLLNTSILKPQKFDSTKKYPVLIFTYGGPGSQVVRNAWGGNNYLWYSMLAQKGYLVFMVDNRGTGARGAAFKKMTYRNLGKWEVHDQIEGVKYLSALPYVDPNRIGIWGWSYGGYTSCLAILLGADYFKAAIAVAPVTHWKFYDTIYSERFMGTPDNNAEGYKQSAPISHVDKLKGKFLLIHGTSDDNVHFQNAAALVSALQDSKKQFETMFYPNKNHGIGGGSTRIHLYTLMTKFLEENL